MIDRENVRIAPWGGEVIDLMLDWLRSLVDACLLGVGMATYAEPLADVFCSAVHSLDLVLWCSGRGISKDAGEARGLTMRLVL